jgi:DNA-binding transcriptional ArsR family regulator
MIGIDRCACFAINPMQLLCRRDWSSKLSCLFQLLFFNTQRAWRLFSPPRYKNGSIKLHYFNGPAVDRDVHQPKGLKAVEIHNNLVATFKGEAMSYSITTYYLRKPSFSSQKTRQFSESPAPILNESDEAILLALSKGSFVSVRHLARATHLHPSTVYNHLMHKLGFTVQYLCWVPHLVSEPDKHTRVQLLFELFAMLQHQKDREGYDIVTLNESRSYFMIVHERICLPEGTEAPERERITIQSRK